MNSIEEKIALLTVRIQELAVQQNVFKAKLLELTQELETLKTQAAKGGISSSSIESTAQKTEIIQPVITAADLLPPVHKVLVQPAGPVSSKTESKPVQQAAVTATEIPVQKPDKKSSNNIEEFLGKNLASKVGILVTVIGIFIGAKYAIERDLISEQVRIILGYLAGIVLAGLGYRFRNKYPAYSAVLMGGGLCVCYFITYIGFTYYHLFPRMVAFVIMVAITAAIVYSSLLYNRVIIAHLAQVGAYAIPFLLSDNSGNYTALFSYIAIINAGMMIVSLKRYWKSLLYAAFGITWFIFLFWFVIVDDEKNLPRVSWIFLSIFFVLFYASFLTYKMVRKEKFQFGDVLLLIPNAFIFFGLGLHLLEKEHISDLWQGGFTVLNAAIHAAVAMIVNKIIGKENHLFSVLISLVITFLAIAVPVAFDGKTVPMLWAAEAAALYFIGRNRKDTLYLNFSVVLVSLGLLGLCRGYFAGYIRWSTDANWKGYYDPFFNEFFLMAVFVLGVCYFLIWFYRTQNEKQEKSKNGFLHVFYNTILPSASILITYMVIFMEIVLWFTNINQSMERADGSFGPWETEVRITQALTLLLYSFVFVWILMAMNQRWFKSKAIRMAGFGAFILLAFLWSVAFLWMQNRLGINYFAKGGTGLYFGVWNVLQRYVMLLPVAGLIYYFHPKFITEPNRNLMQAVWPQLVVILLIVFLSFEYLLWTKVSGANNQYTYGLSILWGLYALSLIAYGIWKKQRGIRFSAMIMLVLTLLKVFILDLRHANTLTRTISYIALGGILLLISYLYNRYKDLLFGKDDPAD